VKKEKLFSITKKDFDIQTFASGGPGGQHQNKTQSGVRIVHRDSGAVGESRTERSQHMNKKLALQRLTDSKKFKAWLNRRVHEVIEKKTVEQKVEEQMKPENLKIEVRDEKGQWTGFIGE
jgi:protein subunit release factor B